MMTMILAVLASTSTRAISRPARLAALIARVTSCWRKLLGDRLIICANRIVGKAGIMATVQGDSSQPAFLLDREYPLALPCQRRGRIVECEHICHVAEEFTILARNTNRRLLL